MGQREVRGITASFDGAGENGRSEHAMCYEVYDIMGILAFKIFGYRLDGG
jgi:hypothetical protein